MTNMTKNINLDIKARGWQFALAYAFRDALPFVAFLVVSTPVISLGYWLADNHQKGVNRLSEFNRLVEECTRNQYEIYGRTDSRSCAKAVNAQFRVYENL